MPKYSRAPLVFVTDRGGHLHNARMLRASMQQVPDALVTTAGPDAASMVKEWRQVFTIPYLFTWVGKQRLLNPFLVVYQAALSLMLVLRLRPESVISLGATDVVFFCYWARLFGARVFHVECMNQVENPSIAGRMLYPICENVFVQWPSLLKSFGRKARYEGWVL